MTEQIWPSVERLEELLAHVTGLRVLVCGDLFLDRYIQIDPARVEVSLETGRQAHQGVGTRCSPGGAGNLAANAAVLGAQVAVLGVIGDDGEGYELIRALQGHHIDTTALRSDPSRPTPSYWKPMRIDAAGLDAEMDRIDLRARTPVASALLQTLAQTLSQTVDRYDLVLCGDQYPEPDCGLFSGAFLQALLAVARAPETTVWVDSRERAVQFTGAILKPNLSEACRAVGLPVDYQSAEPAAAALHAHSGRPVVVTLSERGALAYEDGLCWRIPAVPQPGAVDPTGAGDACLASMALTHAAGASLAEAAAIGMLAAGFAVRQLGRTGTPTVSDLVAIRRGLD